MVGFRCILGISDKKTTMQIKHDVKGQLARLLATEDLIVEHRSVDTASFNVGTRVLTLPTWDNAGEEVYDLSLIHI